MTIGTPRTFRKKFKFVVEIDDFIFAGFQKCSELSAEVAVIEYFEGGTLVADKSAGRVKVSDVTLDRGATKDKDMFNWFKQVCDQNGDAGGGANGRGTGLPDPQYKRDMDIVQLDRDGEELERWTCLGTWPTKFSAGDWDNEADENRIESMTLTLDTFDNTLNV